MKRFIPAMMLLASTIVFSAPASAAVPPPLPPASASFNQGSLHVSVYGSPSKPAMIFIPGLTCGPWQWSGEIAQFSPDYRIYALTLPGFDGQPAIAQPLFQTVSDDFWAMLQAQKIEKPIVIGHSLGGTLAFLLAEQHSDRLAAIVAVDGLPILPGMERMTPAQRQAGAQQTATMVASASTPAAFEAAEEKYTLPYLLTSKSDIASVAPLTARSDPKATAQWLEEDMTQDLRPQLGAVTVPVLEIMPFDPTLDPYGPGKFANAAQKQAYYVTLLKGDTTAHVQAIAPSRHFIMYDQPQALHAAIARFLTGLHG